MIYNPLLNPSKNKHQINQNNLKKDILGLNTDRHVVTPIKLLDNNKRIINTQNQNIHPNEYYSLRKNNNSNLNNIDRNVYMNIRLNNVSAGKPAYINPYNK